MKNLNTVLLDATLVVQDRTNNPIQAFASAQNTIRVTAPFGQSWIPYAIFEAVADRPIGEPTQRIRMEQVGTDIVGGETYAVYETDVPQMVQASSRATAVELVVSFWAKQQTVVNGQNLTFIGVAYFETTPTNAQLNSLFNPENNDYARIIVNGVSSDWVFDGTWTDSEDLFESIIQENRSDVIQYNLRRGKSSLQPTTLPNNTEAILAALQGKANVGDSFTKAQADDRFVNRTGDSMSGPLEIQGLSVKPTLDNLLGRMGIAEADIGDIQDAIGDESFTHEFVIDENGTIRGNLDELDKEAKRQDERYLAFIQNFNLDGDL